MPRRLYAMLVLLLVTALAAAGCSDGGDADTADAGDVETSVEDPADDTADDTEDDADDTGDDADDGEDAADDGEDAAADGYPDDPITFLSGFNPGGGIDLAINTTMVALEESGAVEAPMQIAHTPGGSGLVASAELVNSHDGADDILQLTSISSLSASIQNPGELQITDLVPVALLFQEYSIMYVQADSEYESLDDIAAALQEDPGSVSFAGGSLGSPSNLAIAQFANDVGVPFDQVTYVPLSGGETELALLGGEVDAISGGAENLDFIESGEFRALAVSAEEPLDIAPDIPTYLDQGYDVAQGSWRAVFAPPNFPDHALEFWQEALGTAVESDAFQTAAAENGWGVTYQTGAEFEDFLRSQRESLTQTLQEIGLA